MLLYWRKLMSLPGILYLYKLFLYTTDEQIDTVSFYNSYYIYINL